MGLETGTGIGDLVPTNPLSTDAVSSGDDHLRLIKTVMQSITFLKSIQTFMASGTWTRPAGVRKVLVYCLGGGGGGNGGTAGQWSGSGGSSGAIAMKWIDVTSLATASVAVGAGGTAGAAAGGFGGNGGYTDFGSGQCAAVFGLAGTPVHLGGGVVPRANSAGDIIFTGTAGHPGMSAGTFSVFGGSGGGAGGQSDSPAMANSGGGGGGGNAGPGSGNPGAAGGSGYCIVFEFGW